MPVNYFTLTKNDRDLADSSKAFVWSQDQPRVTTVDVPSSTVVKTNPVRNPSFENDNNDWGSTGGSIPRSHAYPAPPSGEWSLELRKDGTAGYADAWTRSQYPVTPGDIWTVSAYVRAGQEPRECQIGLGGYDSTNEWTANWVGLLDPVAPYDGEPNTQILRYERVQRSFVIPDGVASVEIDIMFPHLDANEAVYIDCVMLEKGEQTATPYFDGDTPDAGNTVYAWTGTPHASASTATTTTVGAAYVPSALAGIPDLHTGHAIKPPTGFHRSVFRAVRDPYVATDDSSNPLATQVYDHCWPLAERLAVWLEDWVEGPAEKGVGRGDLSWPLPTTWKVVPVNGTPDVGGATYNDAGTHSGYYGFQSVSWGGQMYWGSVAAGQGTLRQILAGAEGSTRQVGVILDRLKAANQTKRAAMGGASIPSDVIQRAVAASGVSNPQSSTQRRFAARNALAQYVVRYAIFDNLGTDRAQNNAEWGLFAVQMKEHGLIGTSAFTAQDYTALVDPLSLAISLPAGY